MTKGIAYVALYNANAIGVVICGVVRTTRLWA